jgi:thymidine kinase
MADIFDKMIVGLNKGVALVGANSMGVIEKAKINSMIKTLEDEKRNLAEILGMKVYTLFIEGHEIARDELDSICAEIMKRDASITEQKRQLERIEAEINMVVGSNKVYSSLCKCGHINTEGSKFCAKCGSPLIT